jgi:hypothetical protein
MQAFAFVSDRQTIYMLQTWHPPHRRDALKGKLGEEGFLFLFEQDLGYFFLRWYI